MKKSILFFMLMFFFGSVAYADVAPIELPSGVTVKQGMLLKWKDPQAGVLNLSTVSVAQTEHWDKLGVLNLLWEGWSADLGWSYDANTNSGAVMLGRHFGELGKYLPIAYPLANRVDLTFYPIGMIISDPFNHPTVQGASGLGIIKFDVTF